MPSSRCLRLASAGALIALCAADAHAGVIRGELWLSRQAAAAARARAATAAAPQARRAAPPPGQRDVVDAAIYIERIPEKVERKLTPRRSRKGPPLARVVQARRRFTPRVLVLPAGNAVAFENLDRVYHNTFSVAVARRFDLGKYPPGHRDTVRFDRIGIANLHCDIHSDEIGFVVVVPNHAFTRPDSLGRFALPKLPAGEYRLQIWHPRLGHLSRTVVMPRRGDVRLDLTY